MMGGEIIFLLLGILILALVLISKLRAYIKKRRYLIRKNPIGTLRSISQRLSKNKFFNRIIDDLAIKISVMNDHSYEKNREKSLLAILLILILIVVCLGVILPAFKIIWYLYLFYLALGVIFIACILYTAVLILRMHFTKILPDAYKILNSRFTTEGDILRAIDRSLLDFSPPIRREMTRIRNALRKNDREKIDETFHLMERIYRNEYFTLLLNLILQAYYKGGKDSIKNQFEMVTEEILIDIENQKDLAITSRMYIGISLLLPLSIRWLENFNRLALGEASTDFYMSPSGMSFKIFIFIVLIIYIVSLLFLERTA